MPARDVFIRWVDLDFGHATELKGGRQAAIRDAGTLSHQQRAPVAETIFQHRECIGKHSPAVFSQGGICRRSERGRPTVVCQGNGDDSASLLLDAVDPSLRATLTLRFPFGQGRTRFAVKICKQLGLPPSVGRQIDVSDPWTYRKVIRALHMVRRDPDATSG